MERLAYRQLLSWKNDELRKPLIVRGARQVGKTWILKEFGKREYEHVAYLNCDNEPLASTLFMDYDIKRILRQIEAMTNTPILPGKTLIILDELQEQPKGIHALKYFYENAPEYHIAVAGSLLGLMLHPGESFPVGKVNIVNMYPITFGEFLKAIGDSGLAEAIESCDWKLITALHTRLSDRLRLYYYIGGMPGIVSLYIAKQNLQAVRREQQTLLESYRQDISKHASSKEALKINQVLQAIPANIAKENKKFVYGIIKKGARAAEYETAIQWLVDAGLVHKVFRVNQGLPPLSVYEDMEAFKLYLLDCGLMGAICETEARDVLVGENMFREYKGTLTELYVLMQLVSCSELPKIYYFSSDNSQLEVDFLMQLNGKVVPLEVKADNNLRAKSLKVFSEKFKIGVSWRTSMMPYQSQDWIVNIPLYAIREFCIKQVML